jgi:hypothetical protein
MGLDFVRIECEVVSDSPAQLIAILYEEFRHFEEHFKISCCRTPQTPCVSCNLHSVCPYLGVFNQQLSTDPETVRLHQKPSLPFSLYVCDRNNDALSCTAGMVVIGSAANHAGLFHLALTRMVESAVRIAQPLVQPSLHSYSLDYQGIRHEMNQESLLPDNVILLSGQHIFEDTIHSDSVRLTFTSPLRLIHSGSIAHSFDFATFFRSQLRRCSSLSAYYGTGTLDLDYAGLSLFAQDVVVLEDDIHYSQPAWSKLRNRAGLTGTVECTGLVEPMFSLLLLGSCFNAGKGASFGLGFHTVEAL